MANKLLIIGYVWPEPKSSAAGSRMMQLINAFQVKNYDITFASPCVKSDNAFDLNNIAVATKEIELNNSSFDTFIKALNPDIVMFDRFMMEEQFGWRVAEQCSDTMRILDTEDLHCLRKGRQQAFKDNKPFSDNYLFNDTAKREIASIYRSDLSLIISKAEMEILEHKFKIDKNLLLYVPFMLDEVSVEEQEKRSKFQKRNHFITIGNFLHDPNYNATLYLKETIWPLIKKQLPSAEMHVYGAYTSQKVNQLHNEKDGFLIKGFADDVHKVMQQAKVCLAPIRFGAGLKGKLFDAMQNGTPCIMTTIGSEGVYGNYSPNGFIEDDVQEFANRAVELFKNELLWYKKQQYGFKVLNEKYNKDEHQKRFLERIEETIKMLQTKRLNNFTGQMLYYNTLQGTKYLSKWIEEKNRKTN